MTGATLAALAAAPPNTEWERSFALPSDFLALYAVKDSPDYVLGKDASGNMAILTDAAAPLYITYVADVENPELWGPMFTEVFAARMAAECAELVTQSNTKKQLLLQEYDMHLNDAFANNAIQVPSDKFEVDEWLLAREAGGVEMWWRA
jgi:hypothetical protein